jgi:CxxC-x17-CxxC domain-containing protein
MNDFKKGGFRKGGGDFGGRPKFGNKFGGGDRKFGGGKFGGDRKFGNKFGGDRPFERKELFPATCSSCGKACEVPFRPTGEKPVYCRECFGKQEQAPWRGDDRRERPSFRPERSERPQQSGGDIDGLKYRIASLETKLDRVLELLGGKTPAPLSGKAPVAQQAPVQKPASEAKKSEVKAVVAQAPAKKEVPAPKSEKPKKKTKKGKK